MDLEFYQYDVEVKPEENGQKLKRILRLAVEESSYLSTIKDELASDWKMILYTFNPIPGDTKTIRVFYRKESTDEPIQSVLNM